MKNRLIAVLLTTVMLLSMVVVPVSADNEENGLSFSIISFTEGDEKITEGSELQSVKAGQTFALKIYLKNNTSEEYMIGAYQFLIQYNEKIVELYEYTVGRTTVGPAVKGELFAPIGMTEGGVFKVTSADGSGVKIAAKGDKYDDAKVAYVLFKAREDAESCDLSVGLVNDGSKIVVTRESDPNKEFLMPGVAYDNVMATVHINGAIPALGEVALSTPDSVTVDGKNNATVNATATSAQGTNLTNMVTWSVTAKPDGAGVNDIKIAADGKITVGAKAKVGDYTITATGDGATATGSASATITVERAESVYTVTVTSVNPTLTVPTGTETNTSQFIAAVKDQYDEQKTDATVTWSVDPSDKGVSVSDNGLVTVSADAKKYVKGDESKEFKIRATSSDADQPGEEILTVTREKAVFTSFELPKSGWGSVNCEVPIAGGTEEVNEIRAYALDQYEDAFELPNDAVIVWSIPELEGITIAKGTISENEVSTTVTVTTDAVKNDFTNGENGLELNFNATVSYMKDGKAVVSKEVPCVIRRDESTATSVEISGGKSEFTIPVDKTADEATFTAVVKDQYGQTMTGDNATVTWSITSDNVTGISFSNGKVSVTKDAKNGITSSQEFTVTAKCGSVEAAKNFTVKRAASVVTTIEYTGDTNVVVPDGNGTNECAITLTFEDQYGTEITSGVDSSKLQWTCPEGITVETGSDTPYSVKVTKDALKHFGNERKNSVEVKITAEYDNLTKEIPVTLKLADAEPTSIVLTSNPTGDDIVIPTGDMPNTKTYTATVKDQYGFVITDENTKVTFSMSPASDAGVTFDEKTGTVSVTKNATAEQSYTVTATCGTATASHKFAVKNKNLHADELDVAQANFTYGESGKLNPSATLDGKNVTASYTYQGSNIQAGETPTNAGTYTVTARYETETDIYTGTVDFTISRKLLTGNMLTLTGTYTYNAEKQAVNYKVEDGDLLIVNDYTITGTEGQNAGTYTVTVTGQGNYTGEVTKTWTITPATLTIASATATNRDYEKGKTDVSISNVTFANASNSTVLPSANDYTATGAMTDANAGKDKDVTVTVKLTNGNYTFANGATATFATKVEITKAAYRDAHTGTNSTKYGNTASFDLSSLIPADAGVVTVSYQTKTGDIFEGNPTVSGTTLTYKLKANAEVNAEGTITLNVSSTNYADYTIEVTVTVATKDAQTITASNISATYGDTGVKVNAKAVGELSYEVTTGTDVIDVDASGNVTIKKAGDAKIRISAAETSDYAAATKEITVTIAKRPLTVKADDKTAYVGAEQPELTYTATGLVDGDELTTKPTLKLVHEADVDPMKKAGTYVITFETQPAASENYDLKTENGTLTVRTRHSSGTTTGSTGSVSIDRPENGTVTASPANPVKGSTVTITVTPNKGQTLKDLEVLDKNGNSLPLTDLGNGKFSFVMPEGKVTIKSEFGEENAFVNPYDDVKSGDWYYSAVEYVTANGLMNGTGKGFEPNLATSRAMIWTILARMSGVNTAGSGEWYAVAQQWAVANGVSDGTMPNDTITREQLAAMLYRYAVSKGMVKGPATADLSVFADANSVSRYAVEAMQWAVSTGLISGMDGKLNPQGSATRAQVATMLMRFAEMAK